MIPRFLIAPDSFKNCLSAAEVGQNICKGILQVYPDARVTVTPMADGGEGTIDALLSAIGGEKIKVQTVDPLNRSITSFFAYLPEKQTAIIEMAAASGLELLSEEERDPLLTTTYGTGLLIKAALDLGCSRIIVGLGGSATNDGGAGMAQALGIRLLDKSGKSIALGGKALQHIHTIDYSGMDVRINNTEFIAATDVRNVLCGPKGASWVYGPQKGADESMVELLDTNLLQLAQCMLKSQYVDVLEITGGGAAGGLGAGMLGFLGATIQSGFELIASMVQLEKQIANHDIIITAEGSFDGQTGFGKTPVGVAQIAHKYKKPVFVFAGAVADNLSNTEARGITAVFSITKRPVSLSEAISHAPEWLQDISEMISRLIKSQSS